MPCAPLLERRTSALLLLLLPAACGQGRTPPPPEAPPPAPAVAPFPHALVWTARENVPLLTELGTTVHAPYTFLRFDVLAIDTLGLLARCGRCTAPLEGWIDRDNVIYEPLPPEAAAQRSLAEFALAIREAAIRRDLAALRPVMSRDFTYSFGAGGGPLDAFNFWRFDGFRALEALPALLDQGLASHDADLWSAPPAFVTSTHYHGLRAGFRHDGVRWEWVYLVKGD